MFGADKKRSRAGDVSGELAVLLRDEAGLAEQPVVEALLGARHGDRPAQVREAADRLLRAHAPWALDLEAVAASLIGAAGDARSVRLFVAWHLQPGGRSQAELGAREGVSAQRVGQIVRAGDQRVRAAVAASGGPVAWVVRTVRARLGAVAGEGHVAAVLADLGAERSPAAELVRWLAGPYLPVPGRPGWVALEPREVTAATSGCLAADGGVRRLCDVAAELSGLGISDGQLVPWLAANQATVVHDATVAVTGALADAAERVLDARGTARTAEEIAADLRAGGRKVEPAALTAALRQRRFARTPEGALALATWPREEPPARKRPRRAGGAARRERPAPPEGDRMATAEDRLWLWVRVDADVLRGWEAAVPEELVEGLGMAPLARRTFSSRWGPVTLAREGSQPTRGSVRAIALATGAGPDDTLLLGFSPPSSEVTVEVRHGAAPEIPPDATGEPAVLFPETATGGRH